MNIMIHLDGIETPICVPISKAGQCAVKLEQAGKIFRLGKTI